MFSGVNHLVRYAASPVSLKYNFGVLITRFNALFEKGSNIYIIPDASKIEIHFFIIHMYS